MKQWKRVFSSSLVASVLVLPLMAVAQDNTGSMPMMSGPQGGMPMMGQGQGGMPMMPCRHQGMGMMRGRQGGDMPMMRGQQGGKPMMMQTMETRMANIEELLRQLVELQKQ